MATSTITQTATAGASAPILSLSLSGSRVEDMPAWMQELNTRGWTVVKETLSKEKAQKYVNAGYDWLESWNLGFRREDLASRKAANVPWHIRGGLYARYGIAHEQFAWDLRSEPALVEKFAQIWGTDELFVSYDGFNLAVPDQSLSKTDAIHAPWPHVDQSPLRTNLQCIQGIMNLLPNGPEDGGLMVLDGSANHYTELWEHFDHKKGPNGWNKWEQQFVDEEMCNWLQEAKGCKWVKVCAEPGDLLLWDSRTIHYGAAPSSVNDRFCAYVCYKPTSMVGEEARKLRLDTFEKKHGTAHDPAIIRVTPRLPPEDHASYDQAVKRPLQNPILTARGRQLAGLEPY